MELIETNRNQITQITQETTAFLKASKADKTLKAYSKQWQHFKAWTDIEGISALPASPATVANYASWLSNSKKVSSIEQALASIAFQHRANGLDSPTKTELVRSTLQGVKRIKTVKQTQKQALLVTDIQKMIGFIDTTTAKGMMEKAMILIGFAGCFRRSELVSLRVSDCTFESQGVRVNLRKSKTDQAGQGMDKAIFYGVNQATCPVQALKNWIEVSGLSGDNLLFPVTDQTVARLIKRLAGLAGLDADKLSGHSLRAGFITQAFLKGKNQIEVAKQSGHKSMAVMGSYFRTATVFQGNAGKDIGL